MKLIYYVFIWLTLTLGAGVDNLDGQEPIAWVSQNDSVTNASGAICGIYAVAAAIESCGKEFDLKGFLNSEYSESRVGSSASQLAEIVEEHGLSCTPLQRMNTQSLRVLSSPAILNLNSGDYGGRLTGHWVTFLGVAENGRFLVFDSNTSRKVTEVAPSELALNWQGYALIVSPSNTVSRATKPLVLFGTIVPTLFLVAMIFAAGRVLRVKSGVGAFLGAVALTFLASCLFERPLVLENEATIGWINSKYDEGDFAQIELEEFQDLLTQVSLKNSNTIFVDARTRNNFRYIHLKHTTNLPVKMQISDFRDFVERSDKSTPVVVFCANKSCSWDLITAQRLASSGFENVSIFEGGIAEIQSSGMYEYDERTGELWTK